MVRAQGPQGPHGSPRVSLAASLRQLARIIGVDDKSVRKAEAAGVFGDTVRRDASGVPGVVDLAGAISAWERSGRQLRGSKPARQGPHAAPLLPAPSPAPADGRDEAAAAAEEAFSDGPDDIDAPPAVAQSPSLVEAQRLTMLERQRRLKLENDTREGMLVEVDRARNVAFEFARVLRENVMNVPGRLAAEIAADNDAGRIRVLLEVALREALETTANTMEAPPAPEPTTAA